MYYVLLLWNLRRGLMLDQTGRELLFADPTPFGLSQRGYCSARDGGVARSRLRWKPDSNMMNQTRIDSLSLQYAGGRPNRCGAPFHHVTSSGRSTWSFACHHTIFPIRNFSFIKLVIAPTTAPRSDLAGLHSFHFCDRHLVVFSS